jgi:hypothetical protein
VGLDVRRRPRPVARAVAADHLVELLASQVPGAVEPAFFFDFFNVHAHLRCYTGE